MNKSIGLILFAIMWGIAIASWRIHQADNTLKEINSTLQHSSCVKER